MKRFVLIFLGVVCLLSMIGCSKSNTNNFSETELLRQKVDFEQKEVKTSPETNSTIGISSDDDFENFTVEELENAQKVAEAYYEGTSFIAESIEYDITNTLYEQYSVEYAKENLITFTVKVKESEDPPRGIALKRINSYSEWEVLDEGY
jgi:hypothetical protein